MPGAQERVLRRRIGSIQNTKKITRAMELIAATRVVKAQMAANDARPYSEQITTVIANLAAGGTAVSHPLLREALLRRAATAAARMTGLGLLVAACPRICRASSCSAALLLWVAGSFRFRIAFARVSPSTFVRSTVIGSSERKVLLSGALRKSRLVMVSQVLAHPVSPPVAAVKPRMKSRFTVVPPSGTGSCLGAVAPRPFTA